MWDSKISADIDTMPPEIMKFYAKMCGQTLARGHARTGDRVAIAAYLGSADTFDRAMADFASVYADQNERDYQRVKNAHNGHSPTTTSEPASASSPERATSFRRDPGALVHREVHLSQPVSTSATQPE